eukprot:GILK01000915.1.p1 GENE.GILK01000915.1~~GILK01000915.1.p1  ORF type:complete len:675 (-),score=65.49 GILK01000915.1:286-2310(-)
MAKTKWKATVVLSLFVCFAWTAIAGPAVETVEPNYKPQAVAAIAQIVQSSQAGSVELTTDSNALENVVILAPLPSTSIIADLPISSQLVSTYNSWHECIALFQYLLGRATSQLQPEARTTMWKSLNSQEHGVADVAVATKDLRLSLMTMLHRIAQGSSPSKVAEAAAEVRGLAATLNNLGPAFIELTSIVAHALPRSWTVSAVSNEIMVRLKAVDVGITTRMPAEIDAYMIRSHVAAALSKRTFMYERHTVRLPERADGLAPDLFEFLRSLRDFCAEWFKAFARCDWMTSDPELRPIRSRHSAINAETRKATLHHLIHRFNDLVEAIQQLQRALLTLQSDIDQCTRRPTHVDFALAQFTEIKRNHWPSISEKYERLLQALPDLKSYISAVSKAYAVPEDALKYITDSTNARMETTTLSQDWAKRGLVALRTYVFLKTTKEERIRAVTCDAVNQWSPWAPTVDDRWFACAQRGVFAAPDPAFPAQVFNVIPVPSRLQLYHGSRTLPPGKVPTGRSWFGGFRVALMYLGVDFGKELHHGSHKGIHAFQTARELYVVRLMDLHNNAVMDAHLRRIRSQYTMQHLTGFQPGLNSPLKRTSYVEIDREVFGLLCSYWATLGIHGYADDYAQDQGLHPEMMLCDPNGLIVPIDLPSWPPAPLERLSTKPFYAQFQPLQKP